MVSHISTHHSLHSHSPIILQAPFCISMVGVFFCLSLSLSFGHGFPAVTWDMPPLRFLTSPPALQEVLDNVRNGNTTLGAHKDISEYLPTLTMDLVNSTALPIDKDVITASSTVSSTEVATTPLLTVEVKVNALGLSDDRYLDDFLPMLEPSPQKETVDNLDLSVSTVVTLPHLTSPAIPEVKSDFEAVYLLLQSPPVTLVLCILMFGKLT